MPVTCEAARCGSLRDELQALHEKLIRRGWVQDTPLSLSASAAHRKRDCTGELRRNQPASAGDYRSNCDARPRCGEGGSEGRANLEI